MYRKKRTQMPALASEPFLGGFLSILFNLFQLLIRLLAPRTLVA